MLILLIHLAAAVFENAVGQILKLGGQTLFTADQQPLFLFCGHPGLFQADRYLTQFCFLSAVDFPLRS
ncbi:hypothetical protein D3C80_1275490 [compost metagenome]